MERSATAIASRVLPMPPGPVSVTSRTPGDSSRSATAAMSPSRPINAVDVTGSERRSARGARRRPMRGADARGAKRSLSSVARSSRRRRPSSRGVLNVRYEAVASACNSAIIAASRGSRSGAGVFR